jgi:hypothetical protein
MRQVGIGRPTRDPIWVPFLSPCSYGGALRRENLVLGVQTEVENGVHERLIDSRILVAGLMGGQASTILTIPPCVRLTQQRLCRLCYAVGLFVGVLRGICPDLQNRLALTNHQFLSGVGSACISLLSSFSESGYPIVV